MKVVVTGGAGFLGSRLVTALAKRGALAGPDGEQTIEEIVVFDRRAPEETPEDERISIAVGDIADPAAVSAAIQGEVGCVFHLAAVVSGEAEDDFDLGMRVNLDGTRTVLEACRALEKPPRVVFASSLAAYGGDLPPVIEDDTPLNPQTSYGSQKAACEFLVTDYSRKDFIDGRALRLPTIVVRAGRPNKAASGFASSIIREPLSGRAYDCPVTPETRMWMLSPRRAIEAFIRAVELRPEDWGTNRVLNLPGLSASMAEAFEAMRRVAGEEAGARVSWVADAPIQDIASGWPNLFEPARALTMGFEPDASIDDIIRAFIEDDLDGRVA